MAEMAFSLPSLPVRRFFPAIKRVYITSYPPYRLPVPRRRMGGPRDGLVRDFGACFPHFLGKVSKWLAHCVAA